MIAGTVIITLCLLLILHSYLFYPFLLQLRSKGKVLPDYSTWHAEKPLLTVVMAVHNEQSVIGAKLESLFNTHYPANRLHVIIGSDASTDDTDQIINTFVRHGYAVELVRFEQRTGKPSVLNRLVKQVQEGAHKPDLLVFTDANVIFTPETLTRLAVPFADLQMGLVGANVLFSGIKSDNVSGVENVYNNRELTLKYQEGIIWGTMIGAFGACYAMRTELYTEVPDGFIVDDFYISMKVLEKGYKAILHPKAICYEDVSGDSDVEFRRKARISTGNFQNLMALRGLLSPPWKAAVFCYWSHKVLRWFTPLLLLVIGCTLLGMTLCTPAGWYGLAAMAAVLLLALVDIPFSSIGLHISFLRSLRHFLFMNLALLLGFWRYLNGKASPVWQRTKRSTE